MRIFSPRIESPRLFLSWSKLTKPNLPESGFPYNAKLTLNATLTIREFRLPIATDL